MEVVANNMANTNTPGYKAQEMMFREYLVPTRSTNRAVGDKLSFVQDVGLVRDTREGPLSKTDNPLDLGLHGEGYFQIETEAGMRYTRSGHFRLDEGGMLVDSQGFAVMDTRDQPIIFAPNESKISIAPDGTVSTENGQVAKIKVVRFNSDQDLRNVGDNLFDTTQDPEVVQRPQVMQGMMEESNVEAVSEMTKMMSVLRQYESTQKIIDSETDRMSKAMTVLSGAQAA
jgi:flagellar basal-body rod protein FlgF